MNGNPHFRLVITPKKKIVDREKVKKKIRKNTVAYRFKTRNAIRCGERKRRTTAIYTMSEMACRAIESMGELGTGRFNGIAAVTTTVVCFAGGVVGGRAAAGGRKKRRKKLVAAADIILF